MHAELISSLAAERQDQLIGVGRVTRQRRIVKIGSVGILKAVNRGIDDQIAGFKNDEFCPFADQIGEGRGNG